MSQNIQALYEFIERAAKSRKYPDNTAQGLKAALKLFESVLNDDERNSLDMFRQNLNQIYQSVTVKNGKSFSANSLAVYKSRIQKILSDYEKYGVDPTKMANWSPKIINRGPRKSKKEGSEEMLQDANDSSSHAVLPAVGMSKIELPLRPGIKSVIIVPPDMTELECSRIKAVLDSLVVHSQSEVKTTRPSVLYSAQVSSSGDKCTF
jgi:hypothetical protein